MTLLNGRETTFATTMEESSIQKTSEEILFAVKTKKSIVDIKLNLAEIEFSELLAYLETDNRKKAFWINIYNAFFQILRKVENVSKPDIYKKKLICIAGKPFSLDDIEHGILRKYRSKYSLGYLPDLMVSSDIKSLAVEQIDYRIHFALNCGAKSCPPIAFYNLESINKQLDLATSSFITGDTDVDIQKTTIKISQLFKWYLGDFGGKSGVKSIVGENLNADFSDYKFSFQKYSWDEHLDNYI